MESKLRFIHMRVYKHKQLFIKRFDEILKNALSKILRKNPTQLFDPNCF